MSVAHVWPQDLEPANGWQVGVLDQAMVTKLGTGATISRSYQARPKTTYQGNITLLKSGSNHLDQFRALTEQLRMQLNPLYFIEPTLTDWIRRAYIGIGDGAQKAFFMPFYGQEIDTDVYVDGVDIVLSAPTVQVFDTAANLLTDNQANAVVASTGVEAMAGCSIGRTLTLSCDGIASFRVIPSGTDVNHGYQTTEETSPAAEEGDVLTPMASFYGSASDSYKVDVRWLTAGLAEISVSTASAAVVGAAIDGQWVQAVGPAVTAPATTAFAQLRAYRTTSTNRRFYIGCCGLNVSDLKTWFLPSYSTHYMVFNSPPAAGQIIEATESNIYRMVRVRMTKGTAGWTHVSPGHNRLESIELVEDWAP